MPLTVGNYRIHLAKVWDCIDAEGHSIADERHEVFLQKPSPNPLEVWKVEAYPGHPDFFTIRWPGMDGKYLQPDPGNQKGDGVSLYRAPFADDAFCRWALREVETGVYAIINDGTGFKVAATRFSNKVVVASAADAGLGNWVFEPAGPL